MEESYRRAILNQLNNNIGLKIADSSIVEQDRQGLPRESLVGIGNWFSDSRQIKDVPASTSFQFASSFCKFFVAKNRCRKIAYENQFRENRVRVYGIR